MGLSLLDRDTTARGSVAVGGVGSFKRRRAMVRQRSLGDEENDLRWSAGTFVITQADWKPDLIGWPPPVLENESFPGAADELAIVEFKQGADPEMMYVGGHYLLLHCSGVILTEETQHEYVEEGPVASLLDADCQAVVEWHFDATSVLPAQLVRYIEALSAPEWTLGFDLRNRQGVIDFVEENPRLRQLLVEARETIPGHFGSDVRMALELTSDIDSGGVNELFLLIVTEMSVDAALERMFRLDDEWWLDAVSRADGLMNISIEYA